MTFQQTIIVGRLGRDPETRYTPAGKAVTTFSVATDQKKGDAKITTWFRVSAWEKLSDTCAQYLHVGSQVLVEGRLTCDPETGGPRVWKAQDGTAKASYELTAEHVTFLDNKKEVDHEQD